MPGIAASTIETCVFGSAPNSAEEPENNLEFDETYRQTVIAQTLLKRLGEAKDVAVAGSYAYVANLDSGLHVIDVSSPASPMFFSSAHRSMGVTMPKV